MQEFQRFYELGVVGILVFWLVIWAGRQHERVAKRLDQEVSFNRDVLRALVRDCVDELRAVRCAIEHAPCSVAYRSRAMLEEAIFVPTTDERR
jgi:hypothetical protein